MAFSPNQSFCVSTVCFLWFGLGNLFVLSKQSGGFLYETTACHANHIFYIFPLVLLALMRGYANPTLCYWLKPWPSWTYNHWKSPHFHHAR
jgi:hypothetical protein